MFSITDNLFVSNVFQPFFLNIKTFIFMNNSVTTICCIPSPCMKQAAFNFYNYTKLSIVLVQQLEGGGKDAFCPIKHAVADFPPLSVRNAFDRLNLGLKISSVCMKRCNSDTSD